MPPQPPSTRREPSAAFGRPSPAGCAIDAAASSPGHPAAKHLWRRPLGRAGLGWAGLGQPRRPRRGRLQLAGQCCRQCLLEVVGGRAPSRRAARPALVKAATAQLQPPPMPLETHRPTLANIVQQRPTAASLSSLALALLRTFWQPFVFCVIIVTIIVSAGGEFRRVL